MSTLSVASMASTSSGESVSPIPSPALQPMHHPELAAQVKVPQSVDPLAPGVSAMNGKAFLAKKMAASGHSFYSPTDTLVSPCTAKLHLTKQMRFAKMTKPAKPALISHNSYPSAMGSDHSASTFLREQPPSQSPRESLASDVGDENQAPAPTVGEDEMSQ